MDEKLYTTAEITLATGLTRATITHRASRLGFDRTGLGYTAEQTLAIITHPLVLHRKDEENAIELRVRLNELIEKEGLPVMVVRRKDGTGSLQYKKTGGEKA